MKVKSYPHKCPNCREQALFPTVEDTTVELQHDGQLYTVTVPNLEVSRCTACAEGTWSYDSAGRIEDALRVAAGILMPADILAARLRLGVAACDLAAQLGVVEEVYVRWESGGQLQSRMQDITLRVYFANPDRFLRDKDWPRDPVAVPPAEYVRFLDL